MTISVRDLLEAGCHFGHQTHRWNPKMRSYIYGARNGIYIIDLEKTHKLWGAAAKAIVNTVTRGERVLMVGTKPQAQEVLQEEATRANQHYVNERWLGGMLTNFKTIRSRLDRLEDLETLSTSDTYQKLPKKEIVQLNKERNKLAESLHGIRNMNRLPGLVFIVDPKKEHIAVKEARKLKIPVAAVTDTNCDPDGIDFVIPANDDALKSIRLFLHAVADACLEGTNQFEQRIQEETRKRTEQEKQKAAQKERAASVPTTVEPDRVAAGS